jgi:hypothetical protein
LDETALTRRRRRRRRLMTMMMASTITNHPRGGAAAAGRLGGGGSFPHDDADAAINGVVRVVGTVTQGVISCGKAVLPPTVAVVRSIFHFYRALPQDAILAQIGLVYCFAGGYYPTLFSSVQAARHCGWDVMVAAIQDLTDEACKVIDATSDTKWDDLNRKDLFLQQTNIVLKTVDPTKVNQAAGALYTTWLGVSAVLQQEYARVISLSLTLSYYLERVAHWILEPPVKLVTPPDYHKWVPVVIGWGCKAASMNIAWRIQRVLTASTSAMTGGLMFARALLRMVSNRRRQQGQQERGQGGGGQARKRGRRRQNVTLYGGPVDDRTTLEQNVVSFSPLDEIIGFTVAAIGFWTQMEVQYKNNFSFQVPFPFTLITWPFDFLERWIQWVITSEVE